MPPKRQIKKPVKKLALSPSLPRNKDLPRELLPLVGNISLKESIESELEEFSKVNEYLPSLLHMQDSSHFNLKSPIESFVYTFKSISVFPSSIFLAAMLNLLI